MLKATYRPISSVAAREMRLARRDARLERAARHWGQISPQASPMTRRPQLAQGTSGSPPRDSIAELLGGRRPAEIAGPDLVPDDRVHHRPAHPFGAVELAEMVEHHRGGQDLRRGIGDALPRDVGRAAMHRFEDGGLGADVGARCEAEAADEPRDLVAQN